MLLMLLTVPLYLKQLGEARYGLMALVWLLLGYFSFLELGLGKAASNQIAKSERISERSEIFWTALAVNAGMGTFGALVLYLTKPLLLPVILPPSSSTELRAEVLAAFPWLVATFPIALASSVLNGSLEGRSKFFELNLIQIATSIVFQLVPLAVAYWVQASLVYVIPAAVLSRTLMSLLTLASCRYLLPLQGVPRVSLAKAKQLFGYGSWVAVSAIAVPLLETLERFVISGVMGLVAVTQYTVPMQLVGKLKVFPASLARALFPVFSAGGKENNDHVVLRSAVVLAGSMTVLTCICALLVRPFLMFWIGPDFGEISAPVAEILLLGVWFNGIAHIPYFYLQARDRPQTVAMVQAAELGPYLLCMWFAASTGGLLAVACVWSVRCAVEAIALFACSGLLRKVVGLLTGLSALLIALLVLLRESDPSTAWRFALAMALLAGACVHYLQAKVWRALVSVGRGSEPA